MTTAAPTHYAADGLRPLMSEGPLSLRGVGEALWSRRGTLMLLALPLVPAYGFAAFNLNLAGDDWAVRAAGRKSGMATFALQLGRWGAWFIWKHLHLLELTPALSVVVAVSSLLGFGAVAGAMLGLHRDRWAYGAFVGMMTLSPVWAEAVAFRMSAFVLLAGLVMTAALLAAWLRCWRLWLRCGWNGRLALGLLGAAGLFMLTAAIYQVLVLLAAVMFWGAVLVDIHERREGENPGRALGRAFGAWAASSAGGLAAYAGSVVLIFAVGDVKPMADDAYQLANNASTVSQLLDNVSVVGRHMAQFLFLPQHLGPLVLKAPLWLGGAVLAAAVMGLPLRRGRWGLAIVSAVFLGLILLLPWAVGLLRGERAMRLNALLPLAAVMALGLGLPLLLTARSTASQRVLRSVLAAGACLALFVSIHQHNVGQLVTHSLNRRDFAVAQRILERLEADPAYGSLGEAPLMYLYGRMSFPGRGGPFNTPPVHGPMDSSIVGVGILDQQTGRLPMLMQLLGSMRRFAACA